MGVDWPITTLGEVCSVITDGAHQSPKTVQSGMPMASVKDLNFWGLDLDTARHISYEDYEALVRQGCKPLVGDVLIAKDGNSALDTVCVIEEPIDVVLLSSIAILRPDPDRIDSKYLKYYFMSPSVVDYLKTNFISGAAIPRVVLRDFKRAEISLPNLGEQKSIAHILSALDDKIELNRRMNETLEAIARAIFKSWFVDFDPIHAKASGEPPESICRRFGLTPDLLALFPDRLVDSELGEIPEGWKIGTLGDVAEHPRRGIQPADIAAATPYIALEHMPRRCIALSDWDMADGLESNKFQFRKGEILFGKLRPYFHKVGVAPVDGVCSTDIVVVTPKGEGWFGFVLGHVSSDAFVEHTNAGSTGTKMPRTSWNDMVRFQIVIPSDAISDAFTSLVRPTVEGIIASIYEGRTLAALRDALLPKLLSGELRVPVAGAA